jgi:hypothetical protein
MPEKKQLELPGMPEKTPLVKKAEEYLSAREKQSDLKDGLIEEFRKSGLSSVKISGWKISHKHKETDRLVLKEDSE